MHRLRIHSAFIIHHSAFDPMPTPAVLLILATLLPLASFGVLVFAGRRLGNPLSGWVATAAIGGSFVLSLAAMVNWYNHGKSNQNDDAAPVTWGYQQLPVERSFKWLPIGTASSGVAG